MSDTENARSYRDFVFELYLLSANLRWAKILQDLLSACDRKKGKIVSVYSTVDDNLFTVCNETRLLVDTNVELD
jgi:hypothetical protein